MFSQSIVAAAKSSPASMSVHIALRKIIKAKLSHHIFFFLCTCVNALPSGVEDSVLIPEVMALPFVTYIVPTRRQLHIPLWRSDKHFAFWSQVAQKIKKKRASLSMAFIVLLLFVRVRHSTDVKSLRLRLS